MENMKGGARLMRVDARTVRSSSIEYLRCLDMYLIILANSTLSGTVLS